VGRPRNDLQRGTLHALGRTQSRAGNGHDLVVVALEDQSGAARRAIDPALRVFVAALAVVDDILSVLTIAIFYPREFNGG
jgi:hypothetical protein